MRPRSLRAAAALLAAPSLLLGACILDFGGLTGGRTTGSGSSGSGGGGGSSEACAVLDCTACCADGACAPTPIASAEDADGPWAVAVASDGVYWVNQHGGTVMRRAVGGASPEVLTTAASPVAIAVAGGLVVWAEVGGLWVCPATGCDAQKKKILDAGGPGTIQGVAFDGQFVYFTDHGTGQNDGVTLRCPPDTCAAPLEILGGQIAPGPIALAGDSVFWADVGTGDGNGNVYKAPKSGQDFTQITAALVLPSSIAADDANVYWTQRTQDGKVFRCPHTMGYCDVPEEVAPAADPLAEPLDLALAGGRIYWSSAGDGTIRSCPLPGCAGGAPRVHASGRLNLRRIALGSSCLVWVDDTDGGGVFELPR